MQGEKERDRNIKVGWEVKVSEQNNEVQLRKMKER